jgi:predicted nuclease of restriction endonuclease-like (RecB) superfamily
MEKPLLASPLSPRTVKTATLHRMAKKRRTTPDNVPARPMASGLSADLAPVGYAELLAAIKERVRTAQVRAAVAVNRELLLLYWQIGRDILRRQREEGWGTKVIERLAGDLHAAFPDVKGFSTRNLKYMRSLADAFADEAFVQEVLAQITWYHAITLLDKVSEAATREWYVRQTIAQGWSRNVLVLQIEAQAHRRHGKALTNFAATLPAAQSDLARDLLKDPYNFEFLTLTRDAQEKHLQTGLLEHLREFLIELGVGFAFVGSHYHLEVGRKDYFLDLLFYHLRLRAFVVIDLKVTEFEPEHLGKMNFYLSAVDEQLRHSEDRPSIGLILCPVKNSVVVEYALRDTTKPIGVAGYTAGNALPADVRDQLPSPERLEEELRKRGRRLRKKDQGGGVKDTRP